MSSELALSKLNSLFPGKPEKKIVNFQSEALVKAKKQIPKRELPSKHRAIAMERQKFCKEVYELIKQGMNQEDAVNAESLKTELYPILITAGKKKSSALTVFNYRSWMKRLGKKRSGEPDFANFEAMGNRYSLEMRGVKGAPEFWFYFNGFYLNPNKLSQKEAYRLAVKKCKSEGITNVPEYHQVNYWLKNYGDQAAIMAARYGENWAKNHIASYIRRDWTEVRPNESWFGDHHEFDAPVKMWDDKEQKLKAVRPWLTAWMDAKTLRFVGIYIGVDAPSSRQILIALQNGIRNNNNVCPQGIYCDNGKDYLKRGFSEAFVPKDTDFEHSIVAELGISTRNSKAYNARAKTIEGQFKDVCEGFSKRWAAYLGNRPDARPEISGYFWKHPENLPTLQEFSEEFAIWVQETYHEKRQDGKILNGQSPHEAWKRGVGGVRFNDSDLWFGMLLPYTKNCPTVKRSFITIDKKEYRADALANYFDKKIMVKLDVVNGGPPQAFTLDGRHICPLEEVESIRALATTEEDRAKIAEEMKRQRQELKRAFGIADEMSNGLRHISPQELLLLPPAFEGRIIKSTTKYKSVKGSTHNFVLHKFKEIEETRELTRGEEKEKQLLEMGATVKETELKEVEEEFTQEELNEFHKNMISEEKRRTNEQHEDIWNR